MGFNSVFKGLKHVARAMQIRTLLRLTPHSTRKEGAVRDLHLHISLNVTELLPETKTTLHVGLFMILQKRIPYTSKQDGQCTYNVIFGRIRATIVSVEKQKVLHIPSVCV